METASTITRPDFTDPSEAAAAMAAGKRLGKPAVYYDAAVAYFDMIDVKGAERRYHEDLYDEIGNIVADCELIEILSSPGPVASCDAENAITYGRSFVEESVVFDRKDPRAPRVEAFFAKAEELLAAGDFNGARWAVREAIRACA